MTLKWRKYLQVRPPPRTIVVQSAHSSLFADAKLNKMQGLVRGVVNVKDSTDRRLQVLLMISAASMVENNSQPLLLICRPAVAFDPLHSIPRMLSSWRNLWTNFFLLSSKRSVTVWSRFEVQLLVR